MKKIIIIGFQIFSFSNLIGQSTIVSLPFYEEFNYTLGKKLTPTGTPAETIVPEQGLWVYRTEVKNVNPIIVDQPWTNSKGLPAPKGNALNFKSGQDDPMIVFKPQDGESGSIYASFLFRINSWTTSEPHAFFETWCYPNAENTFFSFAKPGIWPDIREITASNIYMKRDETENGFSIGLAERIFNRKIIYHDKKFVLNQDILIVVQYKFNKNEGTSYLWIDPIISATEPVATLNTLFDKTTDVTTGLDRIIINKISATDTPDITMDELRIANTWAEVVGKQGKRL